MNDRRMRWGIGLFVLVALVLLGALVILFGSLPTVFKRSVLYTVRFTDAPGVSAGTPVRRSGVRIGEVRDVTLDDERGIVRVRMAIDPRFRLYRNEQPTLTVGLLGTDAAIDFIPMPVEEGQPIDRAPLEPGAELVGVRPANVNTLLNRASEVVPTTQETLNDMRKSLQRLEKMSPLAEETLKEYRDLAREINKSIPDLRQTNRDVQKLTRDLDQLVPEVKKTNTEYQKLAQNANKFLPELQKTNDDFASTVRTWGSLGERLNVWVRANQDSITKAIENLNVVLTRLSSVLNEENQRNLMAILKNTRVASERFDSMSRNLDDILRDSRPLPNRLNQTLNKTDETLNSLQKASKPFADRSDRISRNADESLDKLNKLMDDLTALMRVLDQSDSTFRRFLTDPSLYNHLDETACMVLRMMPRLDRVLKDFETFADKVARHPESLGVGGVVRPGSGLKDPPAPFHPPPH